MDIKICEHCGATSQSPEAHISKVSAKVINNGNEAPITVEKEACQTCRGQIVEAVQSLFASAVASINVLTHKSLGGGEDKHNL